MGIFAFFLSIVFVQVTFAQIALFDDGLEYYSPVILKQTLSKPLGSVTQPDASSTKTLHSIRVLIFPHIGPFTIPQGRETDLANAILRSPGTCTLSDKSHRVLQRSNVFHLSAAQLTTTVFIQCSQKAALERKGNLTAYEYNGLFEVKPFKHPQHGKILRIILHLPFEEYLKGVVPAEMPSHWHGEALKAQAIAARSYALYQVKNQLGGDDYDVDDTVLYQAFLGLNRQTSATNKAVQETRGVFLSHNGEAISAFFSADSGGYTESAENVWGDYFPYCPSKPEYYDLSFINSAWVVDSHLDEVHKQLTQKGILLPKAELIDMVITKRSLSGRMLEIELSFTDGSVKKLFGPDFQMAFRLKSNLLDFSIESSGKVQFRGSGFGHGVGMNQTGAQILATKYSWTAQQILSFYYSP